MSEKIKEYIEREAAIELGKKQSCAGIIDGGDFCNISANMLRNIPAADVAEVKHGEWIFGVTMHHEWMKCSVCLVSQSPNGCFSYCPNCGAKMDGGVNDDQR